MLANKNAVANVAVKDLDEAYNFYHNVLGLPQVDQEGDEMRIFKSGSTVINVYRSDYAGTNKATAVTWAVGPEVESIVKQLKAKGVVFEHYDMLELEQKGDIYVTHDNKMKVAWFKDPDGNILNIVNG